MHHVAPSPQNDNLCTIYQEVSFKSNNAQSLTAALGSLISQRTTCLSKLATLAVTTICLIYFRKCHILQFNAQFQLGTSVSFFGTNFVSDIFFCYRILKNENRNFHWHFELALINRFEKRNYGFRSNFSAFQNKRFLMFWYRRHIFELIT